MPNMVTAIASASSHSLCGLGVSAIHATSCVTLRSASRALPASS